MGNFGHHVHNCFRGILLRRNLFLTAVLYCSERASTDAVSNVNMLFKVLGMTSLLSLPLGIVSHPLGGNVGLHAISGYCICVFVFRFLYLSYCISHPLGGCVCLHAIWWHWQNLHWQSGRRNWQQARRRWTPDSRLSPPATARPSAWPRWTPVIPRTTGVSNRTATKFTQLNIEMRSYKMTANQSRTGPEESVGQNLQKPGCQCQQKCWNVMFKVVEDLPIPLAALRNRIPKPFHWSVCPFIDLQQFSSLIPIEHSTGTRGAKLIRTIWKKPCYVST